MTSPAPGAADHAGPVTTTAYWRPSSVEHALDLLQRPGAVVLAGGTRRNGARTADPVEVVDLQAAGLAGTRPGHGDELRIGAMTTLQQLVDDHRVPDVLREGARRERPSTLRAQGTVGGCVATGHAESELLAGLLVHEGVVDLVGPAGPRSEPLHEVLAHLPIAPGHVITAVTVRASGAGACVRTARTPADRAIVAAVARRGDQGLLVALSGVAATPVLVAPAGALDALAPPSDFRGSATYRRALAQVLRTRALEAIA